MDTRETAHRLRLSGFCRRARLWWGVHDHSGNYMLELSSGGLQHTPCVSYHVRYAACCMLQHAGNRVRTSEMMIPPIVSRRRGRVAVAIVTLMALLGVVSRIFSHTAWLQGHVELLVGAAGAIFLAFSAYVLITERALAARAREADFRLCPHCGYSLAGHEVPGRCPECGKAYDTDLAGMWRVFAGKAL